MGIASIATVFKQEIIRYNDEDRLFLETSLNKVDYFSELEEMTKQEIIYNLEEKTH